MVETAKKSDIELLGKQISNVKEVFLIRINEFAKNFDELKSDNDKLCEIIEKLSQSQMSQATSTNQIYLLLSKQKETNGKDSYRKITFKLLELLSQTLIMIGILIGLKMI